MEKTVDYYMNLPYTIELRHDPEDEGWFVRIKELRGCMSEGDTPEEALAMIQEAMALWLEVALEEGIPIPEPRLEEEYSGKFVVRVPRSLHRELVERAREEGVSLNQYINVALAQAIYRPPAPPLSEGATAPDAASELSISRRYEPSKAGSRAAAFIREKAAPYKGDAQGTEEAQDAGPAKDHSL